MSTHVLSLLVEDKPGLLTRVAGLFARRGFNISSLAVGVTDGAFIIATGIGLWFATANPFKG